MKFQTGYLNRQIVIINRDKPKEEMQNKKNFQAPCLYSCFVISGIS